jgi:hypothetical protein
VHAARSTTRPDPTPTPCRSPRNRFDLGYDSKFSAGYRNLAINLLVADRFTVENGVQHHICELQLGLAAFDQLKNGHGHRRYVQWRDARAD